MTIKKLIIIKSQTFFEKKNQKNSGGQFLCEFYAIFTKSYACRKNEQEILTKDKFTCVELLHSFFALLADFHERNIWKLRGWKAKVLCDLSVLFGK